ncbi:MAG TPA: N-succinylarginine dihydrolase [Myxococcales bacterium]
MASLEYNFDGLVGPTHNYAGLSHGNVASLEHAGQPANPRGAALQGLGKMRFVASLGVGQAVLPPHERPSLRTLRQLGFRGSDEQVLAQAAADPELRDSLLRISSSAAAMWTANAATCVPSADARDGRLHLVPANLTAMFHRALEAATTTRVLRAIFADAARFEVHDPLPGGAHFADEGAANHTRLFTDSAVHLFAWGRRGFGGPAAGGEPARFPARQTLEASQALARLGQVDPARALFPQQNPAGIDAGAFHTDVLLVGNANVLLLHEAALVGHESVIRRLRELLGEALVVYLASERELPVASAVAAYPFNSQLVTLPDGSMAVVAPEESREDPFAREFLSRVAGSGGPVKRVHFLDLRQSMQNGGGPACLRQRIVLTAEERAAVEARVFWDEALGAELETWVRRHYRDRVTGADLADPRFARETMAALDELTRILRLGSVYDFQR